jgi:DNA-binding transcriptional ArsR family regulator
MSLESLRQEVSEKLLRFLWRQWSQLGVAGSVQFDDQWVIDPEALLIFSLEVGRYDPRLFDEIADWTVRNGRLVSIQRLKNTYGAVADDSLTRTLSAFAGVVDSHDPKSRWLRLVREGSPAEMTPEPFFLDMAGRPLPILGQLDKEFERVGYLRSSVQTRGMSAVVPMRPPTNLLFRLRAFLGLGPRAEILACLLTRFGGNASDIARSTWYSQPQVQEALSGLVRAEVVVARRRGRDKTYALNEERWLALLELTADQLPYWVDWPRVFAALLEITRFLSADRSEAPSEYLLRSDISTLSAKLSECLADTGIANPFERLLNLDQAAEAFEGRVCALADYLSAPQ